MSGRKWSWFYWLAAGLFGLFSVVRLFSVGDTLGFASLSMAAGLSLAALGESNARRLPLVRLLPQVFMLLALWLFLVHLLGW